jgi:hypothetical protein
MRATFPDIPTDDPVWSNYSCGVGVVLEQAAEPRSAMNPAFGPVLADFMAWEQQDVAFPLVVPLAMKMINEFGQGAPQRNFTEQDQLR